MIRKAHLVLEALSPVCHFDTRTGIDNPTNVRLTMTQPILLNGRRTYVPHVSENALRSVLCRIPLGDHLVRTLDVAGQIPRAVLNLLYSGGAMGSAARVPGDETTIGHAILALYPSLALLGGAVDAMILPRSKLRLNAWLIAREYATAIEHVAPDLAAEARSISAFDLVGDEVRTRGSGGEAVGNQMIYSYQALAAGTRLFVEFSIEAWAPLVVDAALARAVAEWDGFIGGQGRQGRGRMRIASSRGLASPDAYEAHLAEHGEAMRAGLLDGTLGAAKPICRG